MTDILRTVANNIEKYGVHFQYVFPSEDQPDLIPFFYTVGLTDLDLPEIIFSGGISPSHACQIMTMVIDEWKERGFLPGVHCNYIADGQGNGMPMQVRELEVSSDLIQNYVCMAAAHYALAGKKIRVAQLIWCDDKGRLPVEPDFSMRHLQTVFPEKQITMHA